ncbi:MAG TPA: PEP-CTERM sorting domain-containing protein [Pirellulales bacterium]|nr:PEP-CTERM sorting domain-containing protein [Pirellulales bacterium]
MSDDAMYGAAFRVKSTNVGAGAVGSGGIQNFTSANPFNGAGATGTVSTPVLYNTNSTTHLTDLGSTGDASQPYVGGSPGVAGDPQSINVNGVYGPTKRGGSGGQIPGSLEVVDKTDRITPGTFSSTANSGVPTGTNNATRYLLATFEFDPASLINGTGSTLLSLFQTTSTSAFGGTASNGAWRVDDPTQANANQAHNGSQAGFATIIGTGITFLAPQGSSTLTASYTLGANATPSTANMLAGSQVTVTTNFKNDATSGDTLSFSGLTSSVASGSATLTTGTASDASAIAAGATSSQVATQTLTVGGIGTVTLNSNATVTSTTSGTAVTRTNANPTLTINVGNATAIAATGSTPLTTFGQALTGTVKQGNVWATNPISAQTTTSVSGTTATLLDAILTGDRTVSMAFRQRAASETPVFVGNAPQQLTSGPNKGGYGVYSDALQLTGLGATTGTHVQTDEYVLQMSVSDAAFNGSHASLTNAAQLGFLYLGWLDTTGGTGNEVWRNAVEGNFGGTDQVKGKLESYSAYLASKTAGNQSLQASDLGTWGVELTATGANVWAVLNHNSIFAAVPEPSSIMMLGAGLLGLITVVRRRRNAKNA